MSAAHDVAWPRLAFAAALVALGAHALITGDVAGVWGTVPHWFPASSSLRWICGVVALGCGLGLAWHRTTAIAARVLLGWLLSWLVFARLVEAALAPAVEGYWSGCGETLVFATAAWSLAVGAGERSRRVTRIAYGLALIPFGLAHFVYLKETIALVPGWLPVAIAWAMATGGAYIAAAAALLAGVCVRLAAVLVAWQIAGFTALVWLPMAASGRVVAGQWSETVISLALSAAACVIAVFLHPRSSPPADPR